MFGMGRLGYLQQQHLSQPLSHLPQHESLHLPCVQAQFVQHLLAPVLKVESAIGVSDSAASASRDSPIFNMCSFLLNCPERGRSCAQMRGWVDEPESP